MLLTIILSQTSVLFGHNLVVIFVFVFGKMDINPRAHKSEAEKMYDLGLRDGETPLAQIAEEVAVSMKTLRRWFDKWDNELSLKRRPWTGLTRCTTAEQDQALVERMRQHPHDTLKRGVMLTEFTGE